MNKQYNDVKAFHLAFNHPVAKEVKPLTQSRLLSRCKWMDEELSELLTAKEVHTQVDACIDLIYFALGTLVEIGVEPDDIFDIVHIANMQKLHNGKAVFDDSGKVVKPKGWVAPDDEIKDYCDDLVTWESHSNLTHESTVWSAFEYGG